MKLYSQEALILGGIYGVLDTPFAYMKFEYITDFLFIAFVVFIFMLLFNRVPKFVSYIQSNYPIASYYLAAIGWVPYFLILIFFIIILMSFVSEYIAENIATIMFSLQGVDLILMGLSLLAAFGRKKLR
ncbi:MAG: hypothetical protein IKK52_00470 [Alphaproteobacteria bacterium]|nr:hypothetical protein [Alphaproteobacteria bacterium]